MGQTGLLLDGDELEAHLREVLDRQGGSPPERRVSLPRRVPAASSGLAAHEGQQPMLGCSPVGSTGDLYHLCDPDPSRYTIAV